LFLIVGCADFGAAPDLQPPEQSVQIVAKTAGTTIASLVVEVSASDIAPPLILNIDVVGDGASGTLSIPAGMNRTIRIRAYDGNGIETHEGTTSINVQEGINPLVTIYLAPLQGQVPVEAMIGTLTVTVTPDAAQIGVGETLALTAQVAVSGGPPNVIPVVWGSANPSVATVATDGTVTAVAPGSAEIVANVANARGSAQIIVDAGESHPVDGTYVLDPQLVLGCVQTSNRVFDIIEVKIVGGNSIQILEPDFLGTGFLYQVAFNPTDYSFSGRREIDAVSVRFNGSFVANPNQPGIYYLTAQLDISYSPILGVPLCGDSGNVVGTRVLTP